MPLSVLVQTGTAYETFTMSISQVRGRESNHFHTPLDWVLIGAIKPDFF